MTPDTTSARHRSQRVLVAGALVMLLGVLVVGAANAVPRLERDLERRVDQRLRAVGSGLTSSFGGQDGVLRCDLPLDADGQDGARRAALDVWGVRAVELDASCTGGETSSASATSAVPTPTSTTESPAPTTARATSSTPSTTSSTTTTVVATTTTAPAPATLTAQLVDGRIVLSGAAGSDLERVALVVRAQGAVDPSNVVDQLTVDPSVGSLTSEQFETFARLMATMPAALVSGELTWNGSLALRGAYVDEPRRVFIEAIAAAAGVVPTLQQRPTATAEQAASLEADLNALVGAQPILFDKGSTTISAASAGVVQRVAGIAKRYAGVAIVVQGHTDSEGDPARNQTLSEQRAGAVLQALVAQGVPAEQLSSQGFGMTQLIRDPQGNEIAEQSRRVVFDVVLL